MKKTPASQIAFGGMMAALALVIMNMVGLIPIATYVCPSLCMVLLSVVLKLCGKRIGWAWYGAVAILSVLMAPDKEAAMIFAVIGYYPIIKPAFERTKMPNTCKYLYFNVVILLDDQSDGPDGDRKGVCRNGASLYDCAAIDGQYGFSAAG